MARRISLSLILCITLSATPGKAEILNAEPLAAVAVRDVTLALPADGKVKVRWVCPPQDVNQIQEARWYAMCFAVDASGQPWFGVLDRNLVLNPIRQYRFSLSHSLLNLVCLDNGAVLLETERDIGFVAPVNEPLVKDGVPVLPFQSLVSLPLPQCCMYAGAGDCLYVAGPGPSGNHEVYLLQPQRGPAGGTRTLRSFRKVFECPETIRAVAGDGHVTFVAFGSTIARIGRPGRTEPELIVHPASVVTDLAYLPGAGLFYATGTEVGVATDSGSWDFLRGYAEIDLRGGALYVLFKDTLGVLAFDNAADLAKCRPAGPAQSGKDKPPAEVVDLKFYSPGQDRDGGHVFASEFDRDTVSSLSARLQVRPTRKLDGKTLMTIAWTCPQLSYSYHVLLDLTGESSQVCEYPCPWDLGTLGRYTVKVLIDGVEAAGASCEVRGRMSVMEAINADDMATLKSLLEAGASPQERDPNFYDSSALARAVMTDIHAVELLLKHGADVNAADSRGKTPLAHVQDWYGPVTAFNIAAMLIRHGADVNAVDNAGEPVLLDIARAGLPEVVELLLKSGANPNQTVKSEDSEAPLLVNLLITHSVTSRSARTLELLLAYGANPNARITSDGISDGYSALRAVIDTPEPQLMEILLRGGASIKESDRFADFLHSALRVYLDVASINRVRAQKAKDIVAILLRHGATLRPNEEPIVADARLHTWLSTEFILDTLKRNDQAVLDTTDTSVPAIRRMVINRLIAMAIAKAAAATTNDGYNAALALCDQAKTRIESWQMAAECPLVYYNTGLLYRHLGQIPAAKENLKRYLALAPKAPEADQIRLLLQSQ